MILITSKVIILNGNSGKPFRFQSKAVHSSRANTSRMYGCVMLQQIGRAGGTTTHAKKLKEDGMSLFEWCPLALAGRQEQAQVPVSKGKPLQH